MNKNIFALTFLFVIISFGAIAQKATKLPPISSAPDHSPFAFGTVAGIAYACNAGKPLEDYELIASRILQNMAPSKEMESAYIKEYAQAKKSAMDKQKTAPPMPCSQFLKEFKKQKIFQSTVMSDGSVKNPDGTWLLPRGQKAPPKGY